MSEIYTCIQWREGFTVGSNYRIRDTLHATYTYDDEGHQVKLNQKDLVLYFEELESCAAYTA